MRTPLPPRRQTIEAPKQKRNLTLGQYVEVYFASHDLTTDYQDLMRGRVAVFIEWHGSDPKIADLTCDVVNEFLSALMATELRPATVDRYRAYLRAVWWYAYQEGDNENPPLRLKRIRIPQQRIEAFTHQEITQLLIVAAALKGYFPNGVKRSAFWSAAILAAYSTGLRRGDLLRVKRTDITENGTAVIVQSKTGHRVCVQFSTDAMQWIRKCLVDDDDRALPWPFHENATARQFRAILKEAGIDRGSFRWLRRSAGSYAEAMQPGSGSRVLGHRSLAVFNGHYNDETISVTNAVAPPPIVRSRIGRPPGKDKPRLPPTVRIGRQRKGPYLLRWTDPRTLKYCAKSAGTRDEAKALEKKAELEAQLLREMQTA